ncbi:MAG: gamma-glutamylcyclotransferase, partial [Gemmobacter sp.]|uniref:gamma-glutamylcyclotransferase family protein n=1 Tax=Gemmobacter sp. TaxID=1898957 RepID=UPI001A492FF0
MTDLFFYGTLCHAPLLAAVLGRGDVALEPAVLPGHEVLWSAEGPWPVIRAAAGASAHGGLLRGASAEDVARLDFYEGGFGYVTRDLPLSQGRARVYLPPEGAPVAGPWVLAEWVQLWGAAAVATAPDVMALRGQRTGPEVARRYGPMLV